MLLLNVPYEEKEEAKALGARWNPEYKKWSVFLGKDYYKFDKWIPKNSGNIILCDYIYIIGGKHECFKCHKQTSVVGLGVEKLMYIMEDENGKRKYKYTKDDIHICPFIEELPKNICDFAAKNYSLKYGYSNVVKESYLANHCQNCGVIQGNFYLFDEVDSPFFLYEASDAKKLEIYKVKLPYDIICHAEISYSSSDYLIKEYGNIQELNLSAT